MGAQERNNGQTRLRSVAPSSLYYCHHFDSDTFVDGSADAARYLVEFTGIPMTPEEAMKAMEKRQEELFTQVSNPTAKDFMYICLESYAIHIQVTPMPGVLK